MHICYIDEAGCPGILPSSNPQVQPALAVVGLSLPQESLPSIEKQFVRHKQIYLYGEPRTDSRHEDAIFELKGADLRRCLREGSPTEVQRTHKLLDALINTVIAHGAQLYGRILIKTPDHAFDGVTVYADAMMEIAEGFHALLDQEKADGLILADSRESSLNSRVSRAIASSRWAMAGSRFPRFPLPPTFGDSHSHIGLQITDVLTSCLVLPLAVAAIKDRPSTATHLTSTAGKALGRYMRRMSELCRNRQGVTLIRSDDPSSERTLFGGIKVGGNISR